MNLGVTALWKQVRSARWFQVTAGIAAAEYLRFVWKTSRFVLEPADIIERATGDTPLIIAMWHGQHFMLPFLRRDFRVKVLISRHRDGELNAIAAERLGVSAIRGSGDHAGDFVRKGGVAAFVSMLGALSEGWNLAITADVPKVARRTGAGIVRLAQTSGRPIYPVAVATSRRIELGNWDRTAINLPFSRGVAVVGDPIWVSPGAEAIDAARAALDTALNTATARAYAIVDRRTEGAHG